MKRTIQCSLLILIMTLQSSAQQWVNMNPNFSDHPVNELKFKNEQLGFLLIGYDLWRTTDAGESFTMIDSTDEYYQIYFFGDTTLVSGSKGILRSTDNFNNYDIINYPFATSSRSFLLNSSWWAVTIRDSSKFQKSTNGGLTWESFHLPGNTGIYFSDPFHGVVIGTSHSWKTTNGGTTWTDLPPTAPNFEGLYYNNNVVVFSAYNTLFISTDYGYNWNSRVNNFGWNRVTIKDSLMVAYGRSRRMHISYDYGLNWQERLSATVYEYSMDVVNDSIFYMGCDKGSVYKSINRGGKWFCLTSPAFYLSSISVPERGVIFAGGDNLMRSFNDGAAWEVIYGPGRFDNIHFKDRWTGFVGLLNYDYDSCYFIKTTDSGDTWDTLYTWLFSYGKRLKKIYFKDADAGFAIGPGIYFRTTDGGDTWDFGSSPGGNDINFLTAERGYIASDSGGYLTTDGGNTWVHSTNYEGSTIFFVDTLTGFRGHGYALQKTTDGGNTYIDIINHGQMDSWRDLFFWGRDTGIVHFEEHEFILMTTDCGQKWNPIFIAHLFYPYDSFRMKFLSPVYGWAASNYWSNGALYRYRMGITIAEEPEIKEADDYNLNQNYPNPFNSSTVVKYSLPFRTHVHLTVYDILGREVTKLINEEQSGGLHKVEWNAAGYPSGVYLCRLRAGSLSKVIKMISIK